jgi:hypothetical protein
MRKRNKIILVAGLICIGVGCCAGIYFIPLFAIGGGLGLIGAASVAKCVKSEDNKIIPTNHQRNHVRNFTVESIEVIDEPLVYETMSEPVSMVRFSQNIGHPLNVETENEASKVKNISEKSITF